MSIAPVSSISIYGKANALNFGGSERRTKVSRPEAEYSEYQTIWNAYGDSLVEVNDIERELHEVSEQLYYATDVEAKRELARQRDVLETQFVKAQIRCDACKKELYQYRYEHGILA